MNRNKYIALVAGMALALSAHAESWFQFEAGAGVAHYQTAADGRWFQRGMEHSLNLSAPALMAGITGPIWSKGDVGIDWHIDYVNLARVSSQCTCTPLDSNYDVHAHALVANPVPVPNANFTGSGNAQGFVFSIEPYLMTHGWRLGVESGLFIFRPEWNETIYNWAPTPEASPITVRAHTPNNPQIGGVLGVSVGRGPWSVSYEHFFMPQWLGDKSTPPIYRGADVLMVAYRW
jgi:hypothetical protein